MNDIPPELLKSLFDDLEEALFITDHKGLILHMNETASYLVRIPRIAAGGRPLKRLLPPDIASTLIDHGAKALATGIPIDLKRKSIILPGWGFRYFDMRILPYRRVSVDPRIVYLLRDITSWEHRETATEQAREIAESEAEARRNFLARMSHEIRTPMNGIMGMTDLALQTNPPGVVGEYLEVIKNASESLLAIINDILDFTKIESERMELESLTFRIRDHIEETLVLLRRGAQEKGISLTSEIDPKIPEYIIGDPTRIRQIIINLVGNSIKFTDKGGVTVKLSCAPKASKKNENEVAISCSVVDTGIGIEKDKLESLFEPFMQSNAGISRKYGGTGLGLTISRTLARLMGGDLKAESTPGKGSVFQFTIHVGIGKIPDEENNTKSTPPETNRTTEEKSPCWKGVSILLAEDNRVNRLVAENLLTRVGLNVISCLDGNEALYAWKQHAPALILMDIQMPVMDGITATRKIRKKEMNAGMKRTPIIALTAHVMNEERTLAMNAGMDGWISKPLRPNELYAELERLLPPMVSPNNGNQ